MTVGFPATGPEVVGRFVVRKPSPPETDGVNMKKMMRLKTTSITGMIGG